MTKTFKVKFSAEWMEIDRRANTVASLSETQAEELLFSICESLGYDRVWELIESEVKDATRNPMEGEESWSAPQDPGHGRSMRWGDPKRG